MNVRTVCRTVKKKERKKEYNSIFITNKYNEVKLKIFSFQKMAANNATLSKRIQELFFYVFLGNIYQVFEIPNNFFFFVDKIMWQSSEVIYKYLLNFYSLLKKIHGKHLEIIITKFNKKKIVLISECNLNSN